ncbi:hypothetical protein A249_11882, partial [Pseudomonas syringae pv. actinidiae ICMP 18804]
MFSLRSICAAALFALCLSTFPALAAEPPTRDAVQQSL